MDVAAQAVAVGGLKMRHRLEGFFRDLMFRLRSGAQRSVVHWIAFAGGLLYIAYFASRFRLADVWPLRPVGDAAIIFERTRQVFEHADYPARLTLGNNNAVFPYPPSAVLLFRPLAADPALFMAAWFALMTAGFFLMLRLCLVHESRQVRAQWPLFATVALVVAGSAVEWDLRNANSNLIYLALVLTGYSLLARRPAVAGALIGLSVSLKIYSGLLIVWMLVYGPRRAVAACILVVIAMWVVLPVSVFGVEGTLQVYAGWLEQIRIVSDPWVYAVVETGIGPPIVTLRRAAMSLTRGGPGSVAVSGLVWTGHAVWLAVLAWYAWRALQAPSHPVPSRMLLADWIVLLLAPLPLSPWLEPYHAVALTAAALLSAAIALDRKTATHARTLACVLLAIICLSRMVNLSFALRGLILYVQFLSCVVIFGLLRPSFWLTDAEPRTRES